MTANTNDEGDFMLKTWSVALVCCCRSVLATVCEDDHSPHFINSRKRAGAKNKSVETYVDNIMPEKNKSKQANSALIRRFLIG